MNFDWLTALNFETKLKESKKVVEEKWKMFMNRKELKKFSFINYSNFYSSHNFPHFIRTCYFLILCFRSFKVFHFTFPHAKQRDEHLFYDFVMPFLHYQQNSFKFLFGIRNFINLILNNQMIHPPIYCHVIFLQCLSRAYLITSILLYFNDYLSYKLNKVKVSYSSHFYTSYIFRVEMSCFLLPRLKISPVDGSFCRHRHCCFRCI